MSKPKVSPHVRDVMSPVPIALTTDRTLDEAEEFMREFRVVAAPVLASGGSIVGVLTDFQLLKCLLKRSQSTPKALNLGNYLTELEGIHVVGDYEPISEGFKKMLLTPSRRVFVVDKNGKLCGCLEPANLFNFMSGKEEILSTPKKRRRLNSDGQDIPAALEELLFVEAPIPIFEIDPQGLITAANGTLHTLLGYKSLALLGQSYKNLYAHTHHDEVMRNFETAKNIGFLIPVTMSFVKKDQNLIKINMVNIIRRGEGGAIVGLVGAGWLPENDDFIAMLKLLVEERFSKLK
jgi:PAS domain S-box-containing protein